MAVNVDESDRSEMSRAVPRPLGMSLNVLLVVENLVMRTLLSQLVHRFQGLRVWFALTAAEALATISAEQFDVVLVDLEMADFDGTDGARVLVAQAAAAGARLIGLTGLERDARGPQSMGLNECIGMPPTLAELRRVLVGTDDTGDFNPAAWAELRQMFGPSGAAEMARVLALDLPEQRARLNAAVLAGDLAALKHIAHRLRGACQQLEAAALAGLSARVEAAAVDGDHATASGLSGELLRRYAALVDYLQHA